MNRIKENAPAGALTPTSANLKDHSQNTTNQSIEQAEIRYLKNEIDDMLLSLERATELCNIMEDMGFNKGKLETEGEKNMFLSNFISLQALHYTIIDLLVEATLIGQFAVGNKSAVTEANIKNITKRWGGLDRLRKELAQ